MKAKACPICGCTEQRALQAWGRVHRPPGWALNDYAFLAAVGLVVAIVAIVAACVR